MDRQVVVPIAGSPDAPVGGSSRALALLTAIYVINFVDLQIMTILAAQIKDELALSNLELGALTGLAFAACYSALGVPIARVADGGDRVKLHGGACRLWNVMTAACGAAALALFWALRAETAPFAFAELFFVSIFSALRHGPVFAGVQSVAAESNRATAAAALNLVVSLFGLGLGPVMIGAVADQIGGDGGLAAALSVVAIFNICGALHLQLVGRAMRRTADAKTPSM